VVVVITVVAISCAVSKRSAAGAYVNKPQLGC
jgi:hypothetical protein